MLIIILSSERTPFSVPQFVAYYTSSASRNYPGIRGKRCKKWGRHSLRVLSATFALDRRTHHQAMLCRTFVRRVHLFTALVPTNVVQLPHVLKDAQLDAAKKAAIDASPFLGVAPLVPALDLLSDLSNFHQKRDARNLLDECITQCRAELYKPTVSDPFHRLQLHEAIMAAGFYLSTAGSTALKGEATRFVLHHYNFDVRRDTIITRTVHNTLLEVRTSTPESDRLLSDLLLLERRLFGTCRFAPTSGRRWFALGLPLEDIKTEEDLKRVLDIPAVKEKGHFELVVEDTEKMWKKLIVRPMPEETHSLIEQGEFVVSHTEKDLRFECRVQKPPEPIDFWDKLKDTLLRYWVIWFSIWVTFFMVDEEIITITALIFLKWRQTKILEEEAEKTGGKIYIAASTGRALNK
ncbi:hypothetical protein, conserved [Trypanosoma brucei gambiense DAL972]|uniref:Uncharacterized protein n=2 Tax=Trypanosoma brucei TaxID=5691 RepID=C9ZYN3_TRYB9|nr:hypothetical protein, conserved [Trypanosoma brucei gambiense DAL972]RHW70693.1 hypothetical protein DPX39_090059500 [Trypanosoma brucei equiperdum]CBH14532.1 hypothetical protein, conserved [Trypanosoma brucei gambiense DAL972]|eukprot:XP_011776798.1 hypothetical protein, conserved [Trypanosoma brucei gambiense DAL972]